MKKCFLVLLGVVILLLGCPTPHDPDNSTQSDQSAEDFEDVLMDLGIDVNNPTDSEVSVENPLGSAITTFKKDCEIFMSGVPVGADDDELDPNASVAYFMDGSFKEIGKDAIQTWTSHPNKSVAADMDGDGYDEVVSISLSGNGVQLRELSLSSKEYTNKGNTITVDTSESALTSNLPQYRQDIEAADIDGDGYDEIVFVNGLQVFTIDNDYGVLDSSLSMNAISSNGTPIVSIALADFDMDGKAELVLANGTSAADSGIAEYHIYTWDGSWDPISAGSGLVVESGGSGARCVEIGTGNLDDDNMPEIVFGGKEVGSDGDIRIYAMDVSYDDGGLDFGMFDTSYGIGESGEYCIDIAVGNVLGELDGENEIVAWDALLVLKEGKLGDYSDDETDPLKRNYNTGIFYPNGETANHGNYYGMFQLGDVTGDGLDNIVCTDKLNWELYIYYPNANGKLSISYLDIYQDAWTGYGSICLPDVDRDSNSFQYLSHELKFTEPQILSVITSPPYWSNRHQNLNETSLEYSTSTSASAEAGASFTMSQSVSVGAKGECPLLGSTAGELSVLATFTRSLSVGVSAGYTYDVSVTYGCAPGEDKVVYACIPVDVYYYKVLSSEESGEIGDTTTINVPREPIVVSQSRTYYNDHNGGFTDIPPEALNGIEYGNPFSYPTSDDQTAIFETKLSEWYKGLGLYTPEERGIELGKGDSFTAIELGASVFVGASASASFSYSKEIEATAAMVTVGGGCEYEFELSFSAQYSEGISLALSLGDITDDDSYTSDIMFKAGGMAYPQTWEDQEFMLATCWVDPLSH